MLLPNPVSLWLAVRAADPPSFMKRLDLQKLVKEIADVFQIFQVSTHGEYSSLRLSVDYAIRTTAM